MTACRNYVIARHHPRLPRQFDRISTASREGGTRAAMQEGRAMHLSIIRDCQGRSTNSARQGRKEGWQKSKDEGQGMRWDSFAVEEKLVLHGPRGSPMPISDRKGSATARASRIASWTSNSAAGMRVVPRQERDREESIADGRGAVEMGHLPAVKRKKYILMVLVAAGAREQRGLRLLQTPLRLCYEAFGSTAAGGRGRPR